MKSVLTNKMTVLEHGTPEPRWISDAERRRTNWKRKQSRGRLGGEPQIPFEATTEWCYIQQRHHFRNACSEIIAMFGSDDQAFAEGEESLTREAQERIFKLVKEALEYEPPKGKTK